jgi:serine/threonine protein kinase
MWLAESSTSLVSIRYAIKILHPLTNIEHIKREASLWAKASAHINIVPIIAARDLHGVSVIFSEYVEGSSLAEWLKLRAGNALSNETAAEIMAGILIGLAHLHERGIVHRDLKPANVLIQGNTPRLTDFGLARMLRESVEISADTISGTVSFCETRPLTNQISKLRLEAARACRVCSHNFCSNIGLRIRMPFTRRSGRARFIYTPQHKAV